VYFHAFVVGMMRDGLTLMPLSMEVVMLLAQWVGHVGMGTYTAKGMGQTQQP
jgi:hypothetical protein